MSCTERDHIILAFALAANEGNIAAEEAEHAASDGDRQNAQKAVEAARNYCRRSAWTPNCPRTLCSAWTERAMSSAMRIPT